MNRSGYLWVMILLMALRPPPPASAADNVPPPVNGEEGSFSSVDSGILMVITSEEIEKSGALVLGEVLDRIAGLEILDRGYLGAEKEVTLEGYPANQVLILLDGEVANDPYDASLNLNVIPVSAIERIEVVRQPGLLDHGSRAAGGVVRIFTRGYAGGVPKSRVALAGGSFQTGYLEGQFRRGLFGEKAGLSLAFDRVSTDGFGDERGYRAFQYHVRADERAWRDLSLALSVGGTTASQTPVGAESTTRKLQRRFQQAVARACFKPDGPFPLELSAHYTGNSMDSLDSETATPVTGSESRRMGVRLRGTLQSGPSWRFVLGGGQDWSSLVGGEAVNAFSLFTGGSYSSPRLPRMEFMTRWEREGSRYSTWSGGVAVAQPIERRSSVFASLLTATSRPSLAERDPVSLSGETSEERVFEAGVRCRFGGIDHCLSGFGRRSRWGVVQGDCADAEAACRASLDEFGVRVFTGMKVGSRLRVSGGYQGTHVLDSADPGGTLSVPRHHLSGAVEIDGDLKDGTLSYCGRLSGVWVSRINVEGTPSGTTDQYRFIDLNVRLRFIDVTLFYTVRNLLDDRFEIVPGYDVPGRVGRFGLTWDFFD